MSTASSETAPWRKTACILCSLNCGIEVQTGGEGPRGRRILKVHGDPDHHSSKGYLCEKAQRLDHYQNGEDRLRSPMRRRADGTYEPISWDTAIREVADKLRAVRDRHGGASILYYGGGGQGNHLGGAYCDATLKALAVKYRSNALAQEKTGEFWVQGKMFGTGAHGDFERCEVAVFIGKNPWQSHGIPRARAVINEIAKDPKRTLIVIDPRRSETAAKADVHLAIKPGTDAWCLAALVAVVVQEKLYKREWLAQHATGFEEITRRFESVSVSEFAVTCGVDESLLREAARRIANAKSASVLEDLGLQMTVHSTLSSYLQRLVWVLAGHYGREGTSNAFVPFLSLSKASKGEANSKGKQRGARPEKKSPVTGSKVIIGLIPCNVIPDEILTDHPERFRAMIIDSGNPAHSLADSQRMREAIRALDVSVVIDVAMTETARQADYVLPACSQFEKAEATFFNLEFPRNAFHLRQPLFEPLEGTLPESEIHARLLEAMGELSERDYRPLRAALKLGRAPFALAFAAMQARSKRLANYAAVLLYRTLGETLPERMRNAAVLWGVAQMYALSVSPDPLGLSSLLGRAPKRESPLARAGFKGPAPIAANALFDAMLTQPSGVVFADTDYEGSWNAITMPAHKINLLIPELLSEVPKLIGSEPPRDPEFPWILAAGERRSDTSNTAVRDASWHKRGRYGTLRMHPDDAARVGYVDGERVRVVTRRGSAEVELELSDTMARGSVSLPNGQGLDYRAADGSLVRRGVAPNELTDSRSRDFLAGTPWHKYVHARVERINSSA